MGTQEIYLQANHCETILLTHNIYEYGIGKEFKTFSEATRKAEKDFDKEAKMWFKESLKRKVNVHLRLCDAGGFMIKNFTIKSNGNIF
jgi:hypothetical protein